jgi:glycosyltransferase involved in cell wall biosynthesis
LQDFFALAERIADTRFKLLLVGLSEAQIRALPPEIIGLKRTASAEALAALYSGCAAYLNLTYEENYPTTNLEAAACGADVITYASGGCEETLHPHSVAVPTGDLDSVERLVRSLPLKRRDDAPCPPLDSQKSIERYLELYHSVLL